MLLLNNLHPSGEEVKAKNEKLLTRAREERGDTCPNSPERCTCPVGTTTVHPMTRGALPPQRKTMRLRSSRCSKLDAAVDYKRKAFVLFMMHGQRFVALGLSSLKTFALGSCGPPYFQNRNTKSRVLQTNSLILHLPVDSTALFLRQKS